MLANGFVSFPPEIYPVCNMQLENDHTCMYNHNVMFMFVVT